MCGNHHLIPHVGRRARHVRLEVSSVSKFLPQPLLAFESELLGFDGLVVDPLEGIEIARLGLGRPVIVAVDRVGSRQTLSSMIVGGLVCLGGLLGNQGLHLAISRCASLRKI